MPMRTRRLTVSQTKQLEDCYDIIDELKQNNQTPYTSVHKFNEWSDIFIKFINHNNINIEIDEPNLFLHRHKLNDYAVYFMKKDLEKKITNHINLSIIPSAYLNLIIEQFVFQTLYNIFNHNSDKCNENITIRRAIMNKKEAIWRKVHDSISHKFNSYLLHTFTVLNWNEKYRIIYDEHTYSKQLFTDIKFNYKFMLNDDIFDVLKQYYCGLYMGFITKFGGYICIPKYHPWFHYYKMTKGFNDISLHVHGGISFFEEDITIFKFYQDMQKETKLYLKDSVVIGWDYYHSSNIHYAKPGFDIGKALTFDLIKNDVLEAIKSAKCNHEYCIE